MKSLLAGAAGGLAAAYAMNQFQGLWTAVGKQLAEHSGDRQKPAEAGDDATVKTAQAISEHIFDHQLSRAEKKWAGPVVHYAYGTLVGAVYGALAESSSAVTRGYGTA